MSLGFGILGVALAFKELALESGRTLFRLPDLELPGEPAGFELELR